MESNHSYTRINVVVPNEVKGWYESRAAQGETSQSVVAREALIDYAKRGGMKGTEVATNKPREKKYHNCVTINLTTEQREALDYEAAKRGITVSQMLRGLFIDAGLIAPTI